MPIPPFDGITNVIPPFLADPRVASDLTPYECTFEEICLRFATTAERAKILRGCLRLRSELVARGIGGFQWLDGSFVENIEVQENRPPKDIDVVTFAEYPMDGKALFGLLLKGENLIDVPTVKANYMVDHYVVSLGATPVAIVENVRYWTGLFSHRRDGIWKGMLRCPLDDADHKNAESVLSNRP